MQVVILPLYNIRIEGSQITSDLPDHALEGTPLRGALETLESLILAHHLAGVDVTQAPYLEGLRTTLDACVNQVIEDDADLVAAMIEAREMGFDVHPDPDVEGWYYFSDPNGEPSEDWYECEADAWRQVLAELPTYRTVFSETLVQ